MVDLLAVLVGAHGRATLDRPIVTETELDAILDRHETVEELSSATGVFMLADGLSVVAGVLAILVVRRLTARQELHARRVALKYV